jgi:uncharacterized protein
VDKAESRVTRYRHVLYEVMSLTRPTIAVMCVLMLRGPQTIGEIRTRTNRRYDFSRLEEVEATVNSLMSAERPLIVRVPVKAVKRNCATRISRRPDITDVQGCGT